MSDQEFFKETKKSEKTKNLTPLIQVIVCSVALITVFALGRSGASLYTSIKSGYESIMKEDMCSDGILSAVRELFYMTFGTSQQVGKSEEDTSDISKESASEAATAVIDVDAEIETITSSGGEDIRVLEALSDSTLEAVHISKEAVTPVDGFVTSGFGYRIHPITGNESFHTGIDIAAPEGECIAAAYSGTVLETGYTNGRGNYVLMAHGDGLQTLYCHLSEILVTENASLRAGETIGLVGSTGMSTGPHLHFELRVDGIRCDPIYALKDFADEV